MEPYGEVWEDSSLFCIYCLGSGTILTSFKFRCNMKATNTRICFICVQQKWSNLCGRRSNCKSTISGASWQGCHKIWNFRSNLVVIWSTSEKSAELSYIIGNLDWVRHKHLQHDITYNQHFQICCVHNYRPHPTIRWLTGPARPLRHSLNTPATDPSGLSRKGVLVVVLYQRRFYIWSRHV